MEVPVRPDLSAPPSAGQRNTSEFLGEGLDVGAADRGAVEGVQVRGVGDMPDFFPESIGDPVETDFQGLDDRLLLGDGLTFFDAFLHAFLDGKLFKVGDVSGGVYLIKFYDLLPELQGLRSGQLHHPGDHTEG